MGLMRQYIYRLGLNKPPGSSQQLPGQEKPRAQFHSMDGYSVYLDNYKTHIEVIDKLTKCVEVGCPFHFVDVMDQTSNHRLCFDMDTRSSTPISDELYAQFAWTAHAVVSKLFPTVAVRLIALTPGPAVEYDEMVHYEETGKQSASSQVWADALRSGSAESMLSLKNLETSKQEVVKTSQAGADMSQIVHTMYQDVAKQYGFASSNNDSNPVSKLESAPKVYKGGVHGYFNIFIDATHFEAITAILKHELKLAYPEYDVVDPSIKSLRLPGANKIGPCCKCKGLSKALKLSCTLCLGWGKVDQGRPYFPRFVITGKPNSVGVMDNDYHDGLYKDLRRMFEETRLRYYETEDRGLLVVPSIPWARLPQRLRKRHREKATTVVVGSTKPKFVSSKNLRKSVQPNSVLHQALSQWFKTVGAQPHWVDLQIKDISVDKQDKKKVFNALITVAPTHDNHFCRTAKRVHQNATIWFTLSANGLQQYCFHSSCSIDRKRQAPEVLPDPCNYLQIALHALRKCLCVEDAAPALQ